MCVEMRIEVGRLQSPLKWVLMQLRGPTDTSTSAITTRSKPTAFPSALRSKRSAVQTLTEEDVQKDAVIRQTCPECGNKEMRYYTQQLRSADEGSTVFYSCDCGHR